MMSSGKSARSRPMQESYTRRIPAQIQKDMKSSKIAIELKASLMKDSMKSVPREDAAVLVAQL
jgi:GTP cyclohydrolase I